MNGSFAFQVVENFRCKTKLPYVGDRIVECYFWIMRVYFEPPYSFGRMTLSKIIPFISIIDNTYDAYSAIEDAQLFTNAIKRSNPRNLYSTFST